MLLGPAQLLQRLFGTSWCGPDGEPCSWNYGSGPPCHRGKHVTAGSGQALFGPAVAFGFQQGFAEQKSQEGAAQN